MKKLAIATILSAFSLISNAKCVMNPIFTDHDVRATVIKEGGFRDNNKFQSICEKFKRANARLHIFTRFTVLDNRSIAVVLLTVRDSATNIANQTGGVVKIDTNPHASIDMAKEMAVESISTTLYEWNDLDMALESLEQERQKAKAAFQKKK